MPIHFVTFMQIAGFAAYYMGSNIGPNLQTAGVRYVLSN